MLFNLDPTEEKTAVFVNNAAVRDLIVGINLLSTGTVKLRAERDGALEGIEVELKNKEERFTSFLVAARGQNGKLLAWAEGKDATVEIDIVAVA